MSNPDFFTVVEAARVLRIGRTAAYEQSKVYRATEGASGLPVVKMGARLLVPRHQLELLAGGPLSEPEARPEPKQRKKRARTPGDEQPELFEEAG
ncbi:MAG TPA: hypothetical protein VM143_11135 [Acidimicrobiales bacterium]|nr:hypothetical protein [Acidimicrobiales bacterium]